jgi:hypothetical protein
MMSVSFLIGETPAKPPSQSQPSGHITTIHFCNGTRMASEACAALRRRPEAFLKPEQAGTELQVHEIH